MILRYGRGGCKHFIFISTAGVYSRPAVNITEKDVPADPDELVWSYSVEKRKAEMYLEKHYDDYPFMISTIRPTVTYGDARIPAAMVSRENQYTVIDRMKKGKPIIMMKDKSLHNLTHLSTFSDAVVDLFAKEEADRKMFHVSDDKPHTWDDVMIALGEILGIEPKLVHVPVEWLKWLNHSLYMELKYNKMETVILDNRAIKKVAPNVCYYVPLKEGLKNTVYNLENNYSDKPLDNKFNTICDILLMKCRRKCQDERERVIVENFNEQQSLKEKIRCVFYKHYYVARRLARIVINKVKGNPL